MSQWRIDVGDCRDVLSAMPARSVHTVVTSPPYFGLRDYGTGEWEGGDPACDHMRRVTKQDGLADVLCARGVGGAMIPAGGQKATETVAEVAYRETCGKCGARRVDRQIGLEPTPDEFVAALVAVFREVRRVLRDDGTVWLNLGDSYAQYDGQGNLDEPRESGQHGAFRVSPNLATVAENRGPGRHSLPPGLKRKDLVGVPWMVAFALRADGWYLRSDIVWSKPNPMPESVTDRPTKSHEYMFLLSKGPRYFYDADAIREAQDPASLARYEHGFNKVGKGLDLPGGASHTKGSGADGGMINPNPAGRNKRSVWTVATQPYAGAHFATFPPKLIEPCILAGAPERACGECGAPWVRVVERTPMVVRPTPKREAWQAEDDHARTQTGGTMLEPPSSRTLGFEPSCSHGDGSAAGVVLDPFAGAGTTGIVALQHGREFIGIELNPEYARMARERIETAVRLGFRAPVKVAVIDGQGTLFDDF